MRVCPLVRFENSAIFENVPALGAVAVRNWNAYPAARSDDVSAALRSCERFTNTNSPAENGWSGASVTVLLAFENAYVPRTAPLHCPKTRNVATPTVAVSTARSNVTATADDGATIAFSAGDVETT
jgi:hypothetical protein